MLYDVGQILGGCIGGYISDKGGARSPVIAVMLLLSWYVKVVQQYWTISDVFF